MIRQPQRRQTIARRKTQTPQSKKSQPKKLQPKKLQPKKLQPKKLQPKTQQPDKQSDRLPLQARLEVLLLQGKSSYLCAFLAGLLWTLSFEPFSFLPAAYLSFALPCLWVAYDLPRHQGLRRALKLMAVWSFTAYLSSLYWMSHAVWLSFGQSLLGAVTGGVAALLASVFLSLYALAALLALTVLLPRRNLASPLVRTALFVCTFALAESLRGLLFGGFPWNLAGYAWNTSLWLLQTNAVAGIELTSFLALFSYALAALSLFYFARGTREARSAAVRALIGALAIPACAALFGAARLAGAPPFDATQHAEASPFVRIVQPNILQQKKWSEKDAFINFQRTLSLSLQDRPQSVGLLLWPETAFPYRLTTERKITEQQTEQPAGQPQKHSLKHPWLSSMVAVVPQWLAFGAVRENKTEGEDKDKDSRYRNSVLIIDTFGHLQGFYDKVRLVPLGEFIPFTNNRFAKRIKTLTSFPSFASGEESPLLRASPLLTLETQICYESIFPNLLPFVASDQRADLLFNATNDGWFGRSIGPYQHLAMARVRAVERGLPFFRAANTGVSAVFDPFGRERARLALGATGWIDAPLPKKTDRLLITARFGNGLFWLVWFVVTALCLTFVKRKGL